jgi:hypothetical protein
VQLPPVLLDAYHCLKHPHPPAVVEHLLKLEPYPLQILS